MRAIAAAALAFVLAACSPSLAHPSGVWHAAAAPPVALFDTQFAALPGNRVIAIGGTQDPSHLAVTDMTQIYDAATDSWSTAAPIPEARAEPAIATLRSGGLLVIGGTSSPGSALRSAYLFDPKQLIWTRLPDMHTARAAATAVVLADGRVLVLGGAVAWTRQVPAPDDIAGPEVFDPGANTWSDVPALPIGGVVRTSAIVLRDGRVLVAGGVSRNTTIDGAALFDPMRESWQVLPNLPQPRSAAAFQLGPSGEVVMMGGQAFAGSPEGGGFTINPALDSELFDERTLSWSLGSPPTSQRANNFLESWAGVARLDDGRMLVLGVAPALAFAYDPAVDFWQAAGQPPAFQFDATLVTLSDGRVLAVSQQLASIYDPSRSAPVPTAQAGWLDSASTTLVLLAIAAAMALFVLWRRLT